MMTSTIQHEKFCLPRPGEAEPRTETYTADRYSEDDGITVVGLATVSRCIECGARTVDGQPVA